MEPPLFVCPIPARMPLPSPTRTGASPMPPSRARSERAFQRSCTLIPGGVNSPARAFGGVGGSPPFMARGEGPYLFDIDDNRYLDFIGSWGPLILGHAHPAVNAAAEEALRQGSSFGAPT